MKKLAARDFEDMLQVSTMPLSFHNSVPDAHVPAF